MSNAISTSGFSPYGQEVLKRMSVDADFLKSYLKTQGRLYMFPVAVALEFYAQMPNVQFVGTKEQWEKLGYSISQEQDGIKFVDSKANTYNLYEISQLENVKQPPTSWQVTSQNMDFVKNELCKMYSITPDDKTSVLSLVLKNEAVNSDVFDCKKAMNVPEEKENIFFRNYANALALVCAGRLEINNVLSYNVNIDTDYFKELNENEKFLFLSYVKKTAFACLENLKSIVAEYNKQRRINHEIRRMDETVNRTEEKHTDSRVPDNSTNGISDELTDKINNSVQSGQTADRTGNNAENSENGKNNINAVLENETELGESRTDDALRSERNGRNIQSDNGDTARTDNGGRTDRTIWTGMDENDAGRLPDRDGNSTVSAQIPDGSKKSGRDGGAELGSTGRTVQESEPRTENEYDRENELDVRNAESERYSNERLRSDAVFNSNTGRLKLTEQEFAKVVHEAFDEAYIKHSDLIVVPQERGKKLYNRLANQIVNQRIESSNIITTAFKSRSDFANTYGTVSKINATYFGHKLDVIEKEIADNIRRKAENIINSQTSEKEDVIVSADMYKTDSARTIAMPNNNLTAIPVDDAVADELLNRTIANGYNFSGTIITPNGIIDISTAKKSFELITNGEYYNILGINIDNGYNIKTIEANQLLTADEISIMNSVASDCYAEMQRKETDVDDEFSDIDTERIKKNLENPTPEMNAFVQQVIDDVEKSAKLGTNEVAEELMPSEEELVYINDEFKDKFDNVYTQDWSNYGKIRKANDEDTLLYVKIDDWNAYVENFLSTYDFKENPPTVTCEWSESNVFESNKTYSLAEFDILMEKADKEYVNGKEETLKRIGSWDNIKDDADFKYLGYDKTKFSLNIDGFGNLYERQDIGDGFGGMVDFLSAYRSYEKLIPMLRECIEYQLTEQLDEEQNKLAEMKAELDAMESVKEQEETSELSEKPETLEVGDVIFYDGKEWKLSEIKSNGFILDFENVTVDENGNLQSYSFSHIGGVDNFIQNHDFTLVRKADEIENTEEMADEKIIDAVHTDVVLEISLESNIKEWYMSSFPTDTLGKEISDTATFGDIKFNDEQSNVYDVIGVNDSVIRERIEEKYAEITNSDSETFDKVTIYQLKDEYEDYLFLSLDNLEKSGKEPLDIDAYNRVYTEDLEQYRAITVETTLDNIWKRFNINRPSDFTGHSLSKSDVVVIKENNIKTAYYVDRHGFMELPKFFNQTATALNEKENSSQERTADDITIGDRYLLKDSFGEYEATVTSMIGVYPDDVGITREYDTYSTTTNIDKLKLHREGIYLGNENTITEEKTTETTVESKDNNADEAVVNRIDNNISVEPTVDVTVEKPKRIGNSYTHRLYKLFTEQFPDIANGTHSHERYGNRYVEDEENDALEPLSVEHLYGNRYNFMYWYVQNGDLMRDPDFEFILDHEKQELIIQEYQLDGTVYGSIHESTIDENGNYDKKLLNSLSENFLNVLKANAVLERPLTAFTTKDGEEVVVNEKADSEPPVNAETEENEFEELNKIMDNDISAVCREALNEFAREYELGELNITPPVSTGSVYWTISERFPDGSNVNILNLELPNGANNDTLREAIKEWSEQYNNTIPEYIKYGLDEALKRNNGNRNPLPDIQSLPNITYAENPIRKFADNISALKELKRLEEATANGNRLYRIEDKEDANYYSYDRTINPINTKEASDNILRKYSGWGGLSQILDERFKQYESKRNELKELVSDKEYKQILRSTLTAFYTPQNVIDAMYKAISNMDMPYDARILEPSCATGNFFSRLPSRYRNATITGVEIEDTTSKIAKYLNNNKENVTILNMGFEQTNFDNNSFDLVIGNVPFDKNKMVDPDYLIDLSLHDAFFRKAIDKVATGGIVAFITTSGTLDKKSSKIREMFAEKADLVGAIRLPNNVFGGTGVTSDIIFLQKRDAPLDPLSPKPDWCYVTPVEMDKEGKDEKVTEYINSYFAKNPKMILGKMEQSTYQDRKTCVPFKDADLTKQLDEAINSISAVFNVDKQERRKNAVKKIEAWGKNFAYQLKDDKIYYRNNNNMEEFIPKGDKKKRNVVIEKMKSLIELRDITRELVNKQSTNITDEELVPLRNSLNEKYDAFVEKYKTNLSSPDTKKLFGDDIDYPLLFSIEEKTEKEIGEQTVIEYSKSPIFFERTVNPNIEIDSVDSEEEALQVSLNMKGYVNIPYMALLMQSNYPDNSIEETSQIIMESMLEKGLIFTDPTKSVIGREYSGIVDRAEYLSGNVRKKLAIAEDMAIREPERYQRNVEALTSVVPETIPAEDISVRIGVPWVDEKDYEDFLFELSGRKEYERTDHRVKYISALGCFEINNTGKGHYNVNEKTTYGISEAWNMYRIAENMMNQKNIQIHFKDEDGKNCGIDMESTKAVNKCAIKIQKAFKEWIFKDEARKEKYVERYNNIFNSIVGRKYDGSNLTINGLNKGMKLRPYQLDCIARTVYGGNTLAAHVVGAGKSAVMFSSIMKKKQLGLINRACVVVPKALVEQTANEWRKFYPDAKLLTISAKDIGNEKNRLYFASKVATGNFDGVIMSGEQFEKIPCTPEFVAEHKQKQIDELERLLRLEIEKEGKESSSVKKIQAKIEKYEKELDALYSARSKQRGKDNLLYFEELGFDYLVVDEAHKYKNGHFFTKMERLAGVSSKKTGRSADMHMKTDYLNETFGNGHVLFATGTPVTNSMQELYTMTRYLRPDILKDSNTHFFDNWASTFGEVVTKDVMTPRGTIEPRSSFSKFINLPELMGTYKEFADIQSQKKLKLPRPNLLGGKPQVITVEPSKEQKEWIRLIAERAETLQHSRNVLRPNGIRDGMPVLSGEARLLGLGNKMVKALYERENIPLPDDFEENEPSKTDACINKVKEIYDKRNEVGDDKAVQLIFSDIAKHDGHGKFSAYKYIKSELIKKGIPEEEIIFAPTSEAKDKADIFKKINEGKYRVVIASTETLGTGANIQRNLYALHHLDIPHRPSDFEQREGRILRFGNVHDEVEIFNYVTKGTFDGMFYESVLNKARFISQILDDENPARVCEDADEKVLEYGEIVAVAQDNPNLNKLYELKNQLTELKLAYSKYQGDTIELRRELPNARQKRDLAEERIRQLNADKLNAPTQLKITTNEGDELTETKDINAYLSKLIDRVNDKTKTNQVDTVQIGNFKAKYVPAQYEGDIAKLQVKGTLQYTIEVSRNRSAGEIDGTLSNKLRTLFEKGLDKRIAEQTEILNYNTTFIEQAEKRITEPFDELELLEQTELAVEELQDQIYKEQSKKPDDTNNNTNEEDEDDLTQSM